MAINKKSSSKKVQGKSKASVSGEVKAKAKVQAKSKAKTATKTASKTTARTKTKVRASDAGHVVNKISPPHATQTVAAKKSKRAPRLIIQYNYMKAPGIVHDFQVGNTVEVYCDHEKSRERIRGWVSGVVVQVDNKMVAVQFRSNVYLTDGWMVPDRILWYPLNSEHIRGTGAKKPAKKEKIVLDY